MILEDKIPGNKEIEKNFDRPNDIAVSVDEYVI